MEKNNIRTRVAPSPTGSPHIGTVYVALFNYAFARRHGGRFVLRIEDTDRARSTPESESAIFEALRWAGLSWDEGPDVGGAHGPYRQSERTAAYRRHADRLVDSGAAYPCFCTAERLAELRAGQMAAKGRVGYDGLCASLDPADARRRIDGGAPHTIRMRVPKAGECVFADRLRGEIRIPWEQVDHQVLLKSDGFPTYHLANVVDDHDMGITHVIRGEEWIASTPKHVLLYRHFDWTPPEFAHLPLLRNPDQSKLSKRKNPTSALYYRKAGYLPEALLNFLGLMAYSLPDERELFSLEEFCAAFELDRVSLGGPVFDVRKLRHLNGCYLRALSVDGLVDRLEGWALHRDAWRQAAAMAQPRLDTLADFVPMSAFLFADRLAYPSAALVAADRDAATTARLLKFAQWDLERTTPWNADAVRAVFERLCEREGRKLKTLLPPFFVAVTGAPVSLPLFDSMAALGRDMTVRRLQYAIEALEQEGYTLSGKKLKKLEKDYAAGTREDAVT